MTNIKKISAHIERQIDKLSTKKSFNKHHIKPAGKIRKVINESIVRAAESIASQCNNRDMCLEAAVTVLEFYDPYDVISYIGQKVQEGQDIEHVLQQLASTLKDTTVSRTSNNRQRKQGIFNRLRNTLLRRFFRINTIELIPKVL